uniref:Uncharacterized protein n=1 Tax=Cupriavidus taiwanensis TaxID=164546 RepID=A0A375HEI9_9BURK|nr:protein of unknown function [Cupriavidus taiwanensis]
MATILFSLGYRLYEVNSCISL